MPQTAPASIPPPARRGGRPRSLSEEERQRLLGELLSERFVDCPPREVYAQLLEEGVYLASIRTLYRLLTEHGAVRERRQQRRHRTYTKPELKATGPNQVWSWDITYLKGPIRGQHYYLYVVLDIYSRYVVGWLLAERECGDLAQRLIRESCRKHAIEPGALTLHADRGAPMKSKPVAALLHDLQVGQSHSRPHVSNDNPFSEAGFKTLKYHPNFPARFDSLSEARDFCASYFAWYNDQHHHTGIALLTPAQVHFGEAEAILSRRHETLLAAFAAHPERFGYRQPRREGLPEAVWINTPAVAVPEAVV